LGLSVDPKTLAKKPELEQRQLLEEAYEREKNKTRWKNLKVSTKVQVIANSISALIMAIIAVSAISYSWKASVEYSNLVQEQFEKNYELDSLKSALELEVASKNLELVMLQQKAQDEVNLTKLNNFMIEYFNNYYMPNSLSFNTFSYKQLAMWFNDVGELMESESGNTLLAKHSKLLELWRDALTNAQLATNVFYSKSKNKEKRSEETIQGFIASTHNNLVEIYNEINKEYNYDTYLKIH